MHNTSMLQPAREDAPRAIARLFLLLAPIALACAHGARAADDPGPGAPQPDQPAGAAPQAEAQAENNPNDDDLEDLVGTLDSPAGSELLLFADIPVVVTSSREARPMNVSPVPVSILTAEDIHFGGAANLPEALRFVPGISVMHSDRNRYGVGVRGHNHWASTRTLTLIDGRDAEVPFHAAPDWIGMPLFLEDIERVEVVRGAAGGAWGSNAFNGVINIITKDPRDTQGVLLSSRINEFGDTHSFARWGAQDGRLTWRVSLGYVDQESSENAIIDDRFEANDFRQQVILNTKAVYEATEDTTLSMGAAYSGSNQNSPVGISFGDGRMDTVNAFIHLDHIFSDGSSAYVQWWGSYEDRRWTGYAHPRSFVTNLDAQMNLAQIGRHSIAFGGSARWTQIQTVRGLPTEVFFPEGAINYYALGGFVQDRVDLSDRLWLEGQLRTDSKSHLDTDWSARLALIHALDKDQHHIVRAGVGRAYRSLSPELKEGVTDSGIRFIPEPNAPNEHLWIFDAGYHGQLAKGLTFRFDTYYQRYTDLLGVSILPAIPAIATAEAGSADAYGIETELALEGRLGRVSVWYTYNAFEMDVPDTNARSYNPAPHSVGLTGRLFLGDDWTLNANYRYMDRAVYNTPGINTLSASHRLNLAVAKSIADGLGEIQVGVEDAFDRTRAAPNEFGISTPELPGRAFFVRAQVRF